MSFLGCLPQSANRLSVKRHGTEDPHLPPKKVAPSSKNGAKNSDRQFFIATRNEVKMEGKLNKLERFENQLKFYSNI